MSDHAIDPDQKVGKTAIMKWRMRLCLWLLTIFQANVSISQTRQIRLTGTLLAADGKPVVAATVMLMDPSRIEVISYAISSEDGRFLIGPIARADSVFHLSVEHLECDPWHRILKREDFQGDRLELSIQLSRRSLSLKEITVKAPPLPYRTYNDTTEFRAGAYRSAETRRVEDLLKNIQGFQVTGDGRIYFQGKEIERLLLDGEDLTDRNYRLLSKNLNASVVDRIQVIDNYSSDRLMRTMERSGKLAVNLTVDSTFRNRISGGIGVGTTGHRQLVDVSTVYPGRSLKWLTFTNYNQTGLQTGTQLSDDRMGENLVSETRKNATLHPIFEPIQIPAPPLDPRYVLDNEDASTMQVLSMRDKNGGTFRWLAGVGQGKMSRSSGMESHMYALSGNDWVLQQQHQYAMKTQEALSSLQYKHDRKSNNTGEFGLHLMSTNHGHKYDDQTSGDYNDSLSEANHQRRLMLSSRGHEIKRTNSGSLIKWTYGLDLEQMKQHQQLNTLRFMKVLSPFMDPDRFQQLMRLGKVAAQTNISLHDRSEYGRWNTGVKMYLHHERHQLSGLNATDTAMPTDLFPQRNRLIRSQAMILHGTWQSNAKKKTAWYFNGELGIAAFQVRDSAALKLKDRHIYRLSTGIDHKISNLMAIRLHVYRDRRVPGTEWFHAGPVFMSDAQLRFPSSDIVAETSTGMNLSFSRVNLPASFTGLLFISFILTDGAYRQISNRQPAFTRSTYMPFDDQRSLFVSASISKHVLPMRFKFMTDASFQRMDGDAQLDDLPIGNLYGRLSIQQRLISAFPFPFNIELSYMASRHFNALNSEMTGTVTMAQWQNIGYARLNGRFGEKGFFSVIYGHRKFMSSESFRTLDLHGRWKAARSLFISITGHNLTNMKGFEERRISLNATTDQRTSLVGRYILLSAEWSF